MKDRPIHKLQPSGKSIVPRTWCLVDPYRRGVQIEQVTVAARTTCKECIRAELAAKRDT